jgi:hypothetical protein
MGWEQRGKRKFFYRSRRENGRVVREYVGGGEEAEAAAKRDEAERAQRAELKRIGVVLDALRIVIDVLIEDQMIAAGYHRHDRGPWRKKRVAK